MTPSHEEGSNQEAHTMRTLVTVAASALTISPLPLPAPGLADDSRPLAEKTPHVIYLNGASALAELAKTNPNHAARAERILAAASELCKPGPETVSFASFEASDIRCNG